ncbi:MAG: MBL fold metallo-hydrolase [Deltaproteobacteria bacterium]|nr:MBL fold metallo-hydrolase [Deltaproteobacteria bacterium]
MTATTSIIRSLRDLGLSADPLSGTPWKAVAVQSEQCFSYVAWNEQTCEALVVDPKKEDLESYLRVARPLAGYLWLGVIDTHTHADHVSAAAQLAEHLHAPVIMHALAPSKRVDVRIGRETALPSRSSPLHIVLTPGHTPDSITPIWGPFLFGGDTILYGDVGRDDLPGGSPEDHYASVERLKAIATPSLLMLPGHDHKGGRASTWAEQLKCNASLTQPREEFIREAASFDGAAPALLKVSLRENFK